MQEKIASRWGDDIAQATGVVHVTAVGRDERGIRVVLRIGLDSPTSATDSWALGLARARADAIITTGSILRAEPTLCHDTAAPLRRWRAEIVGKSTSPILAILTRGTDVPLDHRALQGRGVLIGTSVEGARHLAKTTLPPGVEVVGLATASLRGLVEELRRRDKKTVCVEAGPSTSTTLYEEPCAVDELMLSTFEETTVPAQLAAGPFVDDATLYRHLGPPLSRFSLREESGAWSFARFRAISPGA